MMMYPIRHQKYVEQGGVTILASLALLVLLTIAGVGMSKNALRSAIASGTARQGAMAMNVADCGIEWSIFWMDYNNSSSATSGTAANLVAMKAALLADESLSGIAYDVMSGTPTVPSAYTPGKNIALSDIPSLTTASGLIQTQTCTLGITRMGKLPVSDTSQGSSTGYNPATGSETKQAPDLWAIRSDSQVTVGGVTFTHGKEVWISTPVQ
jgi:Tfp pilus assembly protein PilX